MQSILRFSRSEIEGSQDIFIPAQDGVMVFLKENKPLFFIRTNDLKKLLDVLVETEAKENPQRKSLEPVLDKYDSLVCYPVEDELQALITEKRLLLQETPEFHKKIRLYDHYPYLSLNIEEPPYLAAKEDTIDKMLYIGPFSDHFFLLVVINTFNQIVKTPACPGSDSPCNLLEEQRCPGYCLKENKQDLRELFEKHLITENHELLANLYQVRKELQNNLEFEKELEIEESITVLEKYYQYLLFFHTAKHITGSFTLNGIEYRVRQGLLESITEGTTTETFSPINNYFDDYEKGEQLALPKESFREMWILFKKFSALYPEKIDEIYENSLLTIKNFFRSEA
ncbi:MAG: hypothetical protein K0B81_03020 [Candidatus Cloacimonetes bacterium]|nr:hypothetical protein [Candidatus Cloacimonadota bacterium]